MVEYFPRYGDEYTRPRRANCRAVKILPCERFQTQKDICREELVYASAQKNSAMKLRELQTRGRGRVLLPVPCPGIFMGMPAGPKEVPLIVASPYERRTHCIVILRVKLLLENTTLGHDQEEKYKDSQFLKKVLKKGY